MRKLLFLFIAANFAFTAAAQSETNLLTKPIVDEGKRLYRSEMASWYGTDIFLEKYKQRENIGGYFSYPDADRSVCVFFSKGDKPKVIGTISFDSTYKVNAAKTDMSERDFTNMESDIYTIRTKALEIINSDTLFKFYKNSNLNLIPMISDGEKKVYVLSGPKEDGLVIFGNDYLLLFDVNNELISRKSLHRNIIPVQYNNKAEDGKVVIGAMHSHLPETGDFITATDICTLMLYEKFAGWKQHTVVSENYISIWNCETDQLTVITTGAIDKIDKSQKKKNRKNKEDN